MVQELASRYNSLATACSQDWRFLETWDSLQVCSIPFRYCLLWRDFLHLGFDHKIVGNECLPQGNGDWGMELRYFLSGFELRALFLSLARAR